VTKSVCNVTPLIFAANEGLTDFYECLLEAGADPNVPDDVSFSFSFPVLLIRFHGDMCMDLGLVLYSIELALGLFFCLLYLLFALDLVMQNDRKLAITINNNIMFMCYSSVTVHQELTLVQ